MNSAKKINGKQTPRSTNHETGQRWGKCLGRCGHFVVHPCFLFAAACGRDLWSILVHLWSGKKPVFYKTKLIF